MKTYKYKRYGRENVIVLDKVVMVHMSESTGWITLQGKDDEVEVHRDFAEGLIKALEEV